MLSGFQRAKAEERHRCESDGPRAFRPCAVKDVVAALSSLYRTCVGELADFLAKPRRDDAAFLAAEEDVFLQAYMYQLGQKTEAEALEPMFEALGGAMRDEERRLKGSLPKLTGDLADLRPSAEDLLSGFAAVRKMVQDLQQLSVGSLESAARMVLSQALLLATRAHQLVLAGLIVVPGTRATSSASEGNELRPDDMPTLCAECRHLRLDGWALARRNTRVLARYARERSGPAAGAGAPVALHSEGFVRSELLGPSLGLVPRDLFACLLRPAEDAAARYLCIPPYCVDIHTRRGSGYPMHREWDDRIVSRNPALQEKLKTHGELDAQGRRMALQFGRYGLVVSDECFPGPSKPDFAMALHPADWEHFQAVVLPVAPLDHGEMFVDRRHFPEGYGPSWDASVLPASSARSTELFTGLSARTSETAGWVMEHSPPPEGGSYCLCSSWDRYANPSTPCDPYFTAAKTFMTWANENSFPSARDFPGGRLPKLLESTATSTIHDDPNGKRLTQAEQMFEMTDGAGQGMLAADAKRSAIDARPSTVTELHRVWMHELLRKQQAQHLPRNLSSWETNAKPCA